MQGGERGVRGHRQTVVSSFLVWILCLARAVLTGSSRDLQRSPRTTPRPSRNRL